MAVFTLDTSTLSGGRWVQRFLSLETGGEFRAIQYDLQDNINNSDVEIHSFGALITPGDDSLEDF